MKSICKAILIFISLFLLFTLQAVSAFALNSVDKIKSDGFITMSTSAPFEPFEYLENSEVVGIDVDLAQKIADKLSVKLNVKNVSIDSLTFELKNNSCDFVCAGISSTPERSKNLDFSDPYFSASQMIITLKNSPILQQRTYRGKK